MRWYVISTSSDQITIEASDQESRLIITFDEDGTPLIQRVYPCGACRWNATCGTNGEDCHT